MDFAKKKSWNKKTRKPFIKNPSRYVFYNFEKILKKDNFCLFLTKNAFCEDVLQKFVEKGVKKEKKNFKKA